MTRNTPLATTLKTDAAALTPPFSQPLHNRLITALRQDAASESRAAVPGDAYRPTWRWPAVAALLALGGGLWLYSALNTPTPQIVVTPPPSLPTPAPGVTPSLPSLPSIPVNTLVQTAIDPTRAKLEAGKYAYLDHDARRLANFVLSQLPGE